MSIDRAYRRLNKALRLALSGEADSVLSAAQEILATRMKHGDVLNSPGAVRDYLRLLLYDREYEVFVVVLVDAQNRVIAYSAEDDRRFRSNVTGDSGRT